MDTVPTPSSPPKGRSGPDVGSGSVAISHTAWKGASRYEVRGCLGQGGMGVVYEAFDRQRQERIALKTLLHFDAGGLYRFKQEFRTLADVLHPNLVHLRELVANEHDEVFFTMELVDGSDFLGHVQRADVPRPPAQSEPLTILTPPHSTHPSD